MKKGPLVMTDDLPELHSDEDVDALMSRLAARLDLVHRPALVSKADGAPSYGDPLESLLAADARYREATRRAIELVVEWMAESRAASAVPIAPSVRPEPTRSKRSSPRPARTTTRRRRRS
jgi:hypothetical protein